MARIRTIKPEFWTDEKMSLLDVTTRLVFLGIISLADDAGRLVDNVKLLDGQLFPNTDDSCRDALDTLARMGRILRYRSESGQGLIQVVRWEAHQKVDKPSKYVLPAPSDAAIAQAVAESAVAEDSRDNREDVASDARESRVPTLDRGPTTGDHGAGSSGAAPDTEVLIASSLRARLTADEWQDVQRFLASRAVRTHAAWLREMLKLIGPGSQFAPSDLAGTCSDALALDEPLGGPHALRAFIAKKRDERLGHSASSPSAPARGQSLQVEATRYIGQIKRMIQHNGVRRIIPRAEVVALGERVERAYDSVGGVDRFISQDPKDAQFLVLEFARALEAQQSAGTL